MKNIKTIKTFAFVLGLIAISTFLSCSNDDTNNTLNDENEIIDNFSISQADSDALLFMLEEEKLARDTYNFLDNQWGINQFANIKNSEQTHMSAVIALLDSNNIDYIVLPEGEFLNQDLQTYYNQFVINGSISSSNALQIVATIEDLDIVDLEDYINESTNTSLIEVFEILKCGSRNHLRSFVSSIENTGNSYTPQFLTQEEYNLIISSNNEQCNQ